MIWKSCIINSAAICLIASSRPGNMPAESAGDLAQ